MDIDADKVKQRIVGRAWAQELCELVESEYRCCSDDRKQALRSALMDLLSKLNPTEDLEQAATGDVTPRDPAMTDTESAAYETETMQFGTWVNHEMCGVPIDYLVWLDGEADFRRNLNRYLRSERGQARQK